MSFQRAYASKGRLVDAELLAPDKGRRMAPDVRAFVEDAEFEVIQAAADSDVLDLISATPRVDIDPDPVSRMRGRAPTPPNGPERLGLFTAAGERMRPEAARQSSLLMPLCAGTALFALAVCWMAGGYAFFTAPTTDPVATASIPSRPVVRPAPVPEPAPIKAAAPEVPHAAPTVTVSGSAGSITVIEPATRPARVERAGSILMIRSGN